jgi:hypothetical protein
MEDSTPQATVPEAFVTLVPLTGCAGQYSKDFRSISWYYIILFPWWLGQRLTLNCVNVLLWSYPELQLNCATTAGVQAILHVTVPMHQSVTIVVFQGEFVPHVSYLVFEEEVLTWNASLNCVKGKTVSHPHRCDVGKKTVASYEV